MNYVITPKALQTCLEWGPVDDWFGALPVPEDGSWNVLAVVLGDTKYIAHREDSVGASRIVVFGQNGDTGLALSSAPRDSWRAMFERIHRASISALDPPLQLPVQWGSYQHENLVAFFACPIAHGAFRWVLQIHPDKSQDVCFWRLTKSDAKVDLQGFEPDYPGYRRIVDVWGRAFEALEQAFSKVPLPPDTTALQAAVDLEATTFGAVVQHRTFSEWLRHRALVFCCHWH